MFGHTFYHNTIRRYVVLFGTLFNGIYINRPDPDHDQIDTIKVPISYGPKDKVLARVTADPNLTRKTAISLPRMAFEITNIQYDGSRKMNTIGKRYKKDSEDPNKTYWEYNPVPYNIDFTLSIIVKNADDGTRIVEQILPFFTPEWVSTVELVPEMDITMDIPIILTSVRLVDTYEGDFETRRTIEWDLTFTCKGYIFGPVHRNGIIKFANTSIFNALSANTQLSTTTVQPGLLANGSPTSNVSATISRDQIYPDDDFGYIVQYTEPIII